MWIGKVEGLWALDLSLSLGFRIEAAFSTVNFFWFLLPLSSQGSIEEHSHECGW
jgi:hypothetical protein